MRFRKLAWFAALALASLSHTGNVLAQDAYPSRPITIVVSTGAGGPVDINTRVFAQKLGEILGQSVVVQNKPGGGSVIGESFVAKAPADGYTLLAITPTITIKPALRRDLQYHPITSFEPIVQAFYTQSLLGVRKGLPINNVNEYIDYARMNPGKLMFAAPGGLGGINHMWGAWLHAETGTKVTFVGYKGASEVTSDLMMGRVDATFGSLTFMTPFMKEGKMIPLAVGGDKRSPSFPNVPTVVEAGILPEFDAVYWVGYVAPKGTPQPIINKLNAAFVRILNSDEEKKRQAELTQTPVGGTPEDFSKLMKSEVSRWQKIVDKSGIRLE